MHFNMKNKTLLVIYIVALLDSISLGLTLPCINSYIVGVLDGTHKLTGLLGSFNIIGQIIAVYLIAFIKHRLPSKIVLIGTLAIAILSNFILGITNSCYTFFLFRSLHFVINQTQTLCKDIAVYNLKGGHRNEANLEIFENLNIIHVIGIIIGPVIGGHLYDFGNCFSCIATFCILLHLISIVLLLYFIPLEYRANPREFTVLSDIRRSLQITRNRIRPFRWKDNGPFIGIQYLTTIGIAAFFMKFSLLLKAHFNASTTSIGYTTAYQNLVVFITRVLVNYYTITTPLFAHNERIVYLIALTTLIISLFLACHAISYGFYMLVFNVLALSRLIGEAYWRKVCKQYETIATLNRLLEMLAPIVIGVFCDISATLAIKFLSIVPPAMALMLALKYTEPPPLMKKDKVM